MHLGSCDLYTFYPLFSFLLSCFHVTRFQVFSISTLFGLKFQFKIMAWFFETLCIFDNFLAACSLLMQYVVLSCGLMPAYSLLVVQSEHDGSEVQIRLNVEHYKGEDILPNMTRTPRVKYITYYEDAESIPGRRTAVWELDKGILVDQIFNF